MLSRMADRLIGCWSPLWSFVSKDNDGDPFVWGTDIQKHSVGEFSFAAVKAYKEVQDDGNVETGFGATFAGVYDGHEGHECARYIREHLFNYLTRFIKKHGTISEEVFKDAFAATDDGFLRVVEKEFRTNQRIASIGSCCLIGIIWNKTIYIANAGNSRAVIGYAYQDGIIARQLNIEHNARDNGARQELRDNFPDVRDIVTNASGPWRFKGVLQVYRCLGDAFLKRPEYSYGRGHRLELDVPITRPVLSAEPSIFTRQINPADRFIIFASDGLWEHMTSQDAAQIVHMNPQEGIARKLIRIALDRAAQKHETTYERIKQSKERRRFHDDITVIVIFIDHDLLQMPNSEPQLSIRTFDDVVASSGFDVLQTLHASTSDQAISPSSIITQLQEQVNVTRKQLEDEMKENEEQKKLMEDHKREHDQELLKLQEEMAQMSTLFNCRTRVSSANTPNYPRDSLVDKDTNTPNYHRQDINTPDYQCNSPDQDTNTPNYQPDAPDQDINTPVCQRDSPDQDTYTPNYARNSPDQDTITSISQYDTPDQDTNTHNYEHDSLDQDSNVDV